MYFHQMNQRHKFLIVVSIRNVLFEIMFEELLFHYQYIQIHNDHQERLKDDYLNKQYQ
jgi:hypothetical protein